jgi:fructokinase
MSRPMAKTEPLIFAGIGELLFDIFEDGTETPGGVPFNFSVYIHQLSSHLGVWQGIIVSSVNSDARGDKIIKSLEELKMSTQYIERDYSRPTGRVSVFMKNGEPGYQIDSEAAWDYIYDRPELKELAGQCSAICFGSLAQRSSVSRNTIRNFIANAPGAIRLYDINQRQNTLTGEAGYTPEVIRCSCHASTTPPLSDETLNFAKAQLPGNKSG